MSIKKRHQISIAGMAAGFLLLGAPAAQADWAWTQWGMKIEQVALVSQGKATPVPDSEKLRHTYRKGLAAARLPHLKTEERIGGDVYVAYLLFDSATETLSCVDLIPKAGARFGELKPALERTYGKPTSETREKIARLEWTTTKWVAARETVTMQEGGLGEKLQFCAK